MRIIARSWCFQGKPTTNHFPYTPSFSLPTPTCHHCAPQRVSMNQQRIHPHKPRLTGSQRPHCRVHAPLRSPQLCQPSRRQRLLGPPPRPASNRGPPHPRRRTRPRLVPKHPPLPHDLLARHRALAHPPHHRQPRFQAPAPRARALRRPRLPAGARRVCRHQPARRARGASERGARGGGVGAGSARARGGAEGQERSEELLGGESEGVFR